MAKRKANTMKPQTEKMKLSSNDDYLFREIKYGQNTLKRSDKNWRSLLINIALPEVKEDLEQAWIHFEHVIESKDFTISLLLDELGAANRHRAVAASGHIDQMNDIVVLCRNQIAHINSVSIKTVKHLLSRTRIEKFNNEQLTKEHIDYMKMMNYVMSKAIKKHTSTIHDKLLIERVVFARDHRSREIKIKSLLTSQALIKSLTMNEMLNSYVNEMQRTQKKYFNVSAQDDQHQIEISNNWQKILYRQETIAELKDKYASALSVKSFRIQQLSAESLLYKNELKALMKIVHEEIKLDECNLQNLVLQSNDVIDYYKNSHKEGQMMMRIARQCANLQTEKENLVPFSGCLQHKQTNPTKRKSKTENDEYTEILSKLELFWDRVSRAEVSRYKLKEKEIQLRHENTRLKEELRCCCKNAEPICTVKKLCNVSLNNIQGSSSRR